VNAADVKYDMRPLVLSPDQQAEAVDKVLAVRGLGAELLDVFAASDRKSARDAQRGAEAMLAALDRVLELLDAPAELYRDTPR
jgi:hypothetical protein